MKKKYVAPKVKFIEMEESCFMAASLDWNPGDGSGDFDVKDENDDLDEEITGAKDNVIWSDDF